MRVREISLVVALLVTAPASPARAAVEREAGPPPDAERRLDRSLTRYLHRRPGRAAVAVLDRTTSTGYAYRERVPFLLASVAKVDILLALLLRAQREHRRLSDDERKLAARMIRFSDNDCAHELYLAIGGRAGLARELHRLGVRDTVPGPGLYWGATRSKPSDQVKVLDRLTAATGPVNAANRRYAVRLMSSVTRRQAWGVSAAADGGWALKNGWLPARVHGGLWTVNSVGLLVADGHELLVAVLSERSPTRKAGIATVERVARLTVRAITRPPAWRHGAITHPPDGHARRAAG
ncbi:serine hydrolase [Nonomuraea sp. NPDC000554]|uniref:serine hydrolase n=1 Tax=Nonomuraea sp. NPDC000554 TaxID=3154259 RepID=UPI00333243EB